MKLYCMCRVKNTKLDSQEFLAPNRFAPVDDKTDFRQIMLQTPSETSFTLLRGNKTGCKK